MLYPVYVHVGDDQYAHSVTIPDFPGCFSAADEWDDLPANIQEAVELHIDGEEMDIPEPSSIEAMLALEQSGEYEGGLWMLIDIDMGRLDTRKERVNLTIPGNALREIDRYAAQHNMKRSGFMVAAALKAARGG